MKLVKLFAMLLVCCTISFATLGCGGGGGAGDDVSEEEVAEDEAGDEAAE